MGLGWLARESKVSVVRSKSALQVSLKNGRR
jgi:hypothetical protein